MKKLAQQLFENGSQLFRDFQNGTIDPSAALGTPEEAKRRKLSDEIWAVHGLNQVFIDEMWEYTVVVLSVSENDEEPQFILSQISDRSETQFSFDEECEYYFRAVFSACNKPCSLLGITNTAIPDYIRRPRRPKKLFFASKSEEVNLRKVR